MSQVLSVGDTMVVTIVSVASDYAENRLAYEITALVAGAPTDQDFVDALMTALATDWKGMLAANAQLVGIMGTLHAFGTPAPYARVQTTTGAGAGTFGGNMMSAQTAGLISWTTPHAGPKYRGRLYTPGVSINAIGSNERPTNTYLTAMDTVAGDIINFSSASTGGRTASCQFCLRNRVGTLTPVTGFRSNAKWATQKRRGDYGKATSNPL